MFRCLNKILRPGWALLLLYLFAIPLAACLAALLAALPGVVSSWWPNSTQGSDNIMGNLLQMMNGELFAVILYICSCYFWLYGTLESNLLRQASVKKPADIFASELKKEDYDRLIKEDKEGDVKDRNRRTQYKLLAPQFMFLGLMFDYRISYGAAFLILIVFGILMLGIVDYFHRRKIKGGAG